MRLILPNNHYLVLPDSRYLLIQGYYAFMNARVIASAQVEFGMNATATAIAITAFLGAKAANVTASANGKADATFGIGFVARALGVAIVTFPDYIPDRPSEFKAVRSTSNENSITLSWKDGDETSRIEVYESEDQRSLLAKITDVSVGEETYARTTSSLSPNSYRLVPVGVTGKKGKSSYIVYSAPSNEIL